MLENDKLIQNILKYLVYFFPLSSIIGNGAVNLNLILIFLFFSIFLFISKKEIKINSTLLLILLFGAYVSALNIFTSSETLKAILYLRYALFSLIIYNIFLLIKIDTKKLIYFYALIFFIISLDILFQYLFKFNLIGIKPFNGNFNSFFGEEKIAGSFLTDYLLFFVLGLFLFFERNKYSKIIIIFLIFLSIISIFLSQNRMSLILAFLALSLLLIFFRKKTSVITASIISFFVFFYFFPENNIKTNYKNFYQNTVDMSIKIKLFTDHLKGVDYKNMKNEIPKTHKTENEFFHLIGSGHAQLFVSSISIAKDNLITGVGLKNYVKACANSKLDLKCSNHPHNYYLEILATTGIISLFFVIAIIFFILKNFFISKVFLKKSLSLNEKFYLILIVNFIVIFFPLKSTGSFFTTGNTTFIYLIIGLIAYYQELIKKN